MSSITSKKAAFHNLGCKVNSYELQLMIQALKNRGCEMVSFDETADIYIVNTCSVTNIADRKSRQMLHRARALNPEAVVVAAGCYSQSRGGSDILADGVDIVIGNNEKAQIADILEEYFSGEHVDGMCRMADIGKVREYRDGSIVRDEDHSRAYIKVEDGCNQFCSYCIIPYVRGRVRSRSAAECAREVRGLVEAGYSEIVLTGINLSAYGSDRSENLLSLTRTLHDIEGLKRIRLSSIEPRVLQEDFVREMAGLEKVCPHFHLSLQSGCTRTLERMNRKYTAREFSEAAFCLREAFFRERGAYPALTADIIVGFPGESEEDFEECRSFLEDFGFFETHVFRYSRRRGTAAARMDGQIPEDIKARRSRILIELGKKNREAFIRELMSNTSYTPELLVEEQIEVEGETYQAGHTGEYVLAAVKSETDLSGKLVRGRISRIVPMAGERSICIIDDFDV